MTKKRLSLQGFVLEAILKTMQEAEKRRLERTLVDLNRRNREITKAASDGFLYGGKFHIPTSATVRANPGQRSSLDYSLWGDADAYMLDIKTTDDDLHFVRQVLFNVLESCTSWQDVRDALPDFLADAVNETRSLPRIQPEAFTIRGNERALRQFEKLKEKVALYRMGRLMY